MAGSDREKYKFSNDWFDYNYERWERYLGGLRDRTNNVLEIGSFEGASTTWLLDELTKKEGSKVTAVDTFEGSVEHVSDEYYTTPLQLLEERFTSNVEQSANFKKLRVLKGFSNNVLPKLLAEQEMFNVIYVDASHTAYDVLCDAVMSWQMLSSEGVMIFDDYEWHEYEDDFDNPKLGVDSFLRCYAAELTVLCKDYQVIIKKKERTAPFRPTLRQAKQRSQGAE